MESLGQKWRYNLKAALRNTVDVREARSREEIDAFIELNAAMSKRKRMAFADRADLIPRLSNELPSPLRPKVLLAWHDGYPVAGAAIGAHGDTAYYLFGASGQRALALKAGYALQWAIVRWLHHAGVRWYDLGGEAGNEGLRQFKSGLIGKGGVVISQPGEFELSPYLGSRVATNLVMCARGLRRSFGHLVGLGLK